MKRRHHTVPRFHLRRFASERDQLVRIELPGDRRHLVAVGDATVERDFYLVETEEGEQTDAFESWLSRLENHMAPAFRSLVDERAWPITDETRYNVAAWMALQHLRAPAIRRATDEVADQLLKLHVAAGGKPGLRRVLDTHRDDPVTDTEVEATWQQVSDFGAYRVAQHPNEHLRLILDMLPGTINMIRARGWSIVRFERKALILADHPVVLIPHDDHPPYMGVGLVTASALLAPLDRRCALVVGDLGAEDRELPGTTRLARTFNQAIAMNARRAVFHHPEDDPLSHVVLPPARIQELETDDLERFKMPEGWPVA